MPTWRPMGIFDLDAIQTMLDMMPRGYREAPYIMFEKLKLFPQGCFVLGADEDASPLGFCVGYPWSSMLAPAYDAPADSLVNTDFCYFIHDLVIFDPAQRQGHGRQIVEALKKNLTGVFRGLMVSPDADTGGFWERCGFRRMDGMENIADYASMITGHAGRNQPFWCPLVNPPSDGM